jgi:hypothetical protein
MTPHRRRLIASFIAIPIAFFIYLTWIDRWVQVLLFDAPQYDVVHIGALATDARSVRARAINDAGAVAGTADMALGNTCKPFVYKDGALHYLPVRPAKYCVAYINNRGDVAGYTQGERSDLYAFYFPAGVTTDQAASWGRDKAVTGINDHGVIVGRDSSSRADQAFMIRDGAAIEPSAKYKTAYFSPKAINNKGEVIGEANFEIGSHLAIFRDGQLLPLAKDGSVHRALAINDRTEVAGIGRTGSGFEAVIAQGDALRFLGTLRGHNESIAYDLNNNGQVVGHSYALFSLSGILLRLFNYPRTNPFIWENGRMFSLAVLTGLDFDDYYIHEIRINDRGAIVAAIRRNGVTQAVLLIPKRRQKS